MAVGKARLSGKTPDDVDFNALLEDGFHDQLLREYFAPGSGSTRHVAIVVFDTVRVIDDKGKGQQANLMVQHIELPTGANLETAEELLISAFRNRRKKQGFPGGSAASTPLDLSGLDEHTTPSEVAKADDDAAFDAAAPNTAAADTDVDPGEGASAPVTPIR